MFYKIYFRTNLTLNEGVVSGKSFPEGDEGYEVYKGAVFYRIMIKIIIYNSKIIGKINFGSFQYAKKITRKPKYFLIYVSPIKKRRERYSLRRTTRR